MDTRRQTDAWIYSLFIGFGLTILASAAGILTLLLLKRPIPAILPAVGLMAAAGLVNLLISPLNR